MCLFDPTGPLKPCVLTTRRCWDPPLLSIAGTPSMRGHRVSPAQPEHILSPPWPSATPSSPSCHPSSPLHSLWQAGESLNWVTNLGKKTPNQQTLVSFPVFCSTAEFESDDQLSSAECQGCLNAATRVNSPGQGGRRMVEEGWDLLP